MMWTISTASLLALSSLFQPTPAPPAVGLAAGIGAGAVGVGLGGLAGADAATGGDGVANNKRRNAPQDGRPDGKQAKGEGKRPGMVSMPFHSQPNEFSACMSVAYSSANKARLMIMDDTTVEMEGVPPECMNVVRNYNAMPNIGEINAYYGGGTTCMNSTAVSITGVPGYMMDYLYGMAGKLA